MKNTNTLLIEILTEELPPINLFQNIGEAFTQNIRNELKSFLSENIVATDKIIVTPRRFGCILNNVSYVEQNMEIVRKGPAVATSLNGATPTPALLGFMRSVNIECHTDLEQKDGYFYAKQTNKGKTLNDVLTVALTTAIKKLPIAKNMRWGDNDYSFVRPVHNLLVLHGTEVVELSAQVLGLTSVNYTYGHRILSNGAITIDSADSYVTQLTKIGKIIPEFNARKELIQHDLIVKAEELGLKLNEIHGLLDEVTALVESPAVLGGEFDKIFLEVPPECLILSMAKNQKYFALLDNNKKLTNKFLFVANIASKDPKVIINGNERVLSARLADAKFFFDVDKKHQLGDFTQKLANVVYHNKLGTQLERVIRLQNIATNFADLVSVPKDTAEHTAYLMKADLTTEMVGEFPEIQGVMGKYYALNNGETVEIANAIEQHYYPRFSGDVLPTDKLSILVALVDKLETLVGIWGIGLVPTGDKDPFALRRASLGIVRILLVNQLNVTALLNMTFTAFLDKNLNPNTVEEVYQFILQRLFNYLTSSSEYSFKNSCVQSICATNPQIFSQIPMLLNKLQNFAENPNNQSIITANKRIENILKKNLIATDNVIKSELLIEKAECQLYEKYATESAQIVQYANCGQWDKYFEGLEEFNLLVANFFDSVMVMDEDIAIRHNRMALLQGLYVMMNIHCKLSELS